MLNGIDFKEFLNKPGEVHALVEGLCEVLCPWPARYRPSSKLLESLKKEHHYYVFGRVMGVIAWILIAKLVQVIFW